MSDEPLQAQPQIPDQYLGDGVHASFDGFHIWLDLRGQDADIRIALDPDVVACLVRYRDNILRALGDYPGLPKQT